MKDLRDLKDLMIHDVQPILNRACPGTNLAWLRCRPGAKPVPFGQLHKVRRPDLGPASEPRGNSSKRLKDFYLKARARIWP
jgi:hypothetical protein